jgi:hypothetical protein
MRPRNPCLWTDGAKQTGWLRCEAPRLPRSAFCAKHRPRGTLTAGELAAERAAWQASQASRRRDRGGGPGAPPAPPPPVGAAMPPEALAPFPGPP